MKVTIKPSDRSQNCRPRKLLAPKPYTQPSSAAIAPTCPLSTRRMIVPVIKVYLGQKEIASLVAGPAATCRAQCDRVDERR